MDKVLLFNAFWNKRYLKQTQQINNRLNRAPRAFQKYFKSEWEKVHAAGCLDFELRALRLFTLSTHQNLRFQPSAMVRHAKIRPQIQKNHHHTGRSFVARNHFKPLHPQDLLSNSPKPRTVDMEENIKLSEKQICLLVGLARWERRWLNRWFNQNRRCGAL